MDRGNGKAQMVILVPQELIDRADALRIALRTNRARVLEPVIEAGLEHLESFHTESLARVAVLAERAEVSVGEYVRLYAEMYQRMTYGPTLEELESGKVTVFPLLRPANKSAA